jgi:hypothetical protein
MQDAVACWAHNIGAALIGSNLGASELIVGLLVATTFVAFAANSLIPQREHREWGAREPSHR